MFHLGDLCSFPGNHFGIWPEQTGIRKALLLSIIIPLRFLAELCGEAGMIGMFQVLIQRDSGSLRCYKLQGISTLDLQCNSEASHTNVASQ
jgi:hypothetical protein